MHDSFCIIKVFKASLFWKSESYRQYKRSNYMTVYSWSEHGGATEDELSKWRMQLVLS